MPPIQEALLGVEVIVRRASDQQPQFYLLCDC